MSGWLLVLSLLVWQPPLQKQILGITLRPQASRIVDQIELKFGRPIEIHRRNSDPNNVTARGFVSDVGVPTIEMPENFPNISEDSIVHEILHINQRVRGFAQGVPRFHSTDMRAPHAIAFAAIHDKLRPILGLYFTDVIEHSVFFPQMIDMGLDPYSTSRAMVQMVVSAQRENPRALPADITFNGVGSTDESLALWYFRVAMTAGDPSLVEATEKSVTQTVESLRLGRGLVKIVKSHNPRTPQEAAETTIAALKLSARTIWQVLLVSLGRN